MSRMVTALLMAPARLVPWRRMALKKWSYIKCDLVTVGHVVLFNLGTDIHKNIKSNMVEQINVDD